MDSRFTDVSRWPADRVGRGPSSCPFPRRSDTPAIPRESVSGCGRRRQDDCAAMRLRARPIVYGSPGQIEVLIESIARLIDREPDEVMSDSGVQDSCRRLAGLINRRLAGTTSLVRPQDEGS